MRDRVTHSWVQHIYTTHNSGRQDVSFDQTSLFACYFCLVFCVCCYSFIFFRTFQRTLKTFFSAFPHSITHLNQGRRAVICTFSSKYNLDSFPRPSPSSFFFKVPFPRSVREGSINFRIIFTRAPGVPATPAHYFLNENAWTCIKQH